MAINSEKLLKIVAGVFNAAPGAGFLAELEAFPGTELAFAQEMAATGAFTTVLGGATTPAEIAAVLSTNFGLPSDGVDGSAATQAIQFFTDGLTAGRDAGDLVLEAVNFLETPGLAAEFAPTALLLSNKAAVSAAYSAAKTSTSVADLQTALSGVTGDAALTPAEITALVDAAPGTPVDEATFDNTFTLTTSTDSLTGTADDDLFDAPQGTLATTDVVLDSSTSDADALNAVVTTATLAPRLQNVETLNITGAFATSGFDLGATTGTTTLNVDTDIIGGTGTVINASSLNAVNVNAGSNLGTLNVTAAATGTRDAVMVDAGSATTVAVTGGAGLDTFDVTIADKASATLDGGALAGDGITVHVGATATLSGGAGGTERLTIDAAADSVVTLGAALTAVSVTPDTIYTDITGAGNVTIKGTTAQLTAFGYKQAGTGSVTVKVTDATAASDFDNLVVDTVELTTASGGAATVTINEASTLNLTGDATGGGAVTVNVDNIAGTLAAAAGTALINVSQTLTTAALTTDVNVGTLVLQATPDAAADTANGAEITILNLDTATGTNTETVVLRGTDNLTITTFTNDATASVLSAADMSGELTIGTTVAAGTYVLGSAADTVTVGNVASTIHGNGGNDTLTGGTAADIINGNAGNDTIAGGAVAANTIDGGAGDDKITTTFADAVTLGAGADTLTTAVDIGSVVADFVVGEDLIVLTGGVPAAAINLAAVTAPTAGAYDIDGEGTVDFTLTGSTATDLTTIVQLGSLAAGFATNGKSITAGTADDHLAVTDAAATIIGGTGKDVLTLTAGTTAVATIKIAEGDSTTTNFDTINTGFTLGDGTATVARDILDLPSTTIASAGVAINGTDTGVFTTHTVTAPGIVTFNAAVDVLNFADAISYLGTNIADGETVVLAFAGNSYVFQGGATSDTLVELTGIAATGGLATTDVLNAAQIA